LFSVNEMFGLADTFQRNTNPDFVLMTIGKTTRGAIERAYDWLIPIISRLPGTIERLPASASCFLLLRAYGAEDGEDRAKLQELSAPLLSHVRGSLNGDFGEADAARAFDLLFTDVSSRNPERRRSARRVLQDAIGESSEPPPGDTTVFHNSNNTWMINLSKVQHADLILSDAIKHMVSDQ
jgi:integrator complex subunit 1